MKTKAFLGIDVSKGYADFILLGSEAEVIESDFQLFDNRQGHARLKVLIRKWKDNGIDQLFCGVESTGGYENNWYSLLKGLQSSGELLVSRLNPKAVKSVSDAVMRRSITDAVSAENIALYLLKFPEKVNYSEGVRLSQKSKEGRCHLTSIRMFLKQKTQLGNQLEMLLYEYFPEILIYCRHGIPRWVLQMLIKYPTADKVYRSRNKLLNIKGISKQKAESLIKKAGQNDRLASEHVAHMISCTAREVLHRDDIVIEEKDYLNNIHKDDTDVRLLTSIAGVGLSSAVWIVLEIERISRFKTSGEVSSYFGVHPTLKQSGDGKWSSRMSKKGRSSIRATLYMCGMTGIRHNPILKRVYTNARTKGMNHFQAMGVVMHKLLRIIYGVLKTGKEFDAGIDEANRLRATQKQKENEERQDQDKKTKKQRVARYQAPTIDAPISSRNTKKRKEQIASQTSDMEVNAGLPSADTNI